jgi:hypothetical protein
MANAQYAAMSNHIESHPVSESLGSVQEISIRRKFRNNTVCTITFWGKILMECQKCIRFSRKSQQKLLHIFHLYFVNNKQVNNSM